MQIAGKPTGRKRLIAAGAAVLGVLALMTAAMFTDIANLNLGSGSDGSGIGGNNRFNIQVVGTDGNGNPVADTWQEADTEEGVTINVPGADMITPGDTVSVSIPFRNESPALSAAMTFSLNDRPGFVSDPQIAEALRYTVTLNGTPLVTAATQSAVADLDLGTLAAGSQGTVKIDITLPDQGNQVANNALSGQVSYVQAHFDATSVQP